MGKNVRRLSISETLSRVAFFRGFVLPAVSSLCTLTDPRPALPASAGHLEEQSGAESRGHDLPRLRAQQEVRLNETPWVGGALP